MPPLGWSVLLVRVITWSRHCVNYTGCPWSSASFSNCGRSCTSLNGTKSSTSTRTCLVDIRHYFSFSTSLCKQPTLWDACDSSEDRWTVFLVCWYGSMEFSTYISTGHLCAFKRNLKTELFNCAYTTFCLLRATGHALEKRELVCDLIIYHDSKFKFNAK